MMSNANDRDLVNIYLDAAEQAVLAEGWSKSQLEIALDAANYAILMDNEKLAALVIEYIYEHFGQRQVK